VSYLLRRTKKFVWVGDKRDREAAIGEFERRDRDTDGFSVFEVTTDHERMLVVAAHACDRRDTSRLDLIEIERDVIEQYGPVSLTPESGTTSVRTANELHRSLDWPSTDLRRLAEDLFDQQCVPAEYARGAVKDAVCALALEDVIGDAAVAFVRAEQAKRPPPQRGG
jgi:hypothetical protein